jgi:hypothetical protein
MTYEFDLVPGDYIAMSWDMHGGQRKLFQASLQRAAVVAVVSLLVLTLGRPESLRLNVVITLFLGAAYALLMPRWWRRKWLKSVQRHYATQPHTKLFGHHRLIFSEEGIRSIGPLHDSLRKWPSVTSLKVTDTHFLLPTIWGNVYTLPRVAVDDQETLRRFIEERIQSASRPAV